MALPSLIEIIDILPQALMFLQVAGYIVLAWVFGSLALRGFHKEVSFPLRAGGMMGTGFLALIGGVSLRDKIFFFDVPMLEVIQMDVFISGLVCSVILMAALHMITRKEGRATDTVEGMKRRISLLRDRLDSGEKGRIPESEARKIAEGAVPGYEAASAKMKGADWEVGMEKGDKTASVTLYAYSGATKGIRESGDSMIADPLKIAGVAIIVLLVVFSATNFRGFPSIFESLSSLIGMDPENLMSLAGAGENLPEGCAPVMKILMKEGISIVGGENIYSNHSVEEIIESETGRQVMLMYESEYRGMEQIISITLPPEIETDGLSNEELMNNAEICSAANGVFCECVSMPDINAFTGMIIAG